LHVPIPNYLSTILLCAKPYSVYSSFSLFAFKLQTFYVHSTIYTVQFYFTASCFLMRIKTVFRINELIHNNENPRASIFLLSYQNIAVVSFILNKSIKLWFSGEIFSSKGLFPLFEIDKVFHFLKSGITDIRLISVSM